MTAATQLPQQHVPAFLHVFPSVAPPTRLDCGLLRLPGPISAALQLTKPRMMCCAVLYMLFPPADDGRIKLINYLKYLLFNNGPLATTGCDRGAFVNTRGKRLF